MRKLTQRGHQSSVVGTQYGVDQGHIARDQFGRWSQENFFHYAGRSFDLDRLIDYQLESVPDTVEVVNPRWRQLDGQVRRDAAALTRSKAVFGALSLKGDIESDKVLEVVSKKHKLQEEIEQQEAQLGELKRQRREQKRKLPLSGAPGGRTLRSVIQPKQTLY